MTVAKTIEDLPCVLTADEAMLKSKELCQLSLDCARLEEQKKIEAALLKTAIDAKLQKIEQLVKEVHAGEELRQVECYERPRYADDKVDLIRVDTGAVVRTRGMHPAERQLALDVGGGGGEVGVVSKAGSRPRKKREEVDDDGAV